MRDSFPFSALPIWQHTLGAPFAAKGVGLHTGALTQLTILPAAPGTGLVFVRTDIACEGGGGTEIALCPRFVLSTKRGTTLGQTPAHSIATTEHLLAALSACGIDNARIEVSGPEIPAMDGSARQFVDLIIGAGVQRQSTARRYIEICKAVELGENGKLVRFEPADGLQIKAMLDYPDTLIGQQNYQFSLNATAFIRDIAPARTFALAQEVSRLRDRGLARGGGLENCLVVDGLTLQNQGGLRFKDEFVRHKILDILGDIALANAPILGRFTSRFAGHKLNHALLRALLDDPSAWRWTTLLVA